MKAIIQRVKYASVTVDTQKIAQIDKGLLILLGVGNGDSAENVAYLTKKIAALRIFCDAEDKMNRSILDIGGEAIVVSQFTLFADTKKGNRPSFMNAAPPELAAPLCEQFAQMLRDQGVPTQSGIFGASMQVELQNDGPVTICMNHPLE